MQDAAMQSIYNFEYICWPESIPSMIHWLSSTQLHQISLRVYSTTLCPVVLNQQGRGLKIPLATHRTIRAHSYPFSATQTNTQTVFSILNIYLTTLPGSQIPFRCFIQYKENCVGVRFAPDPSHSHPSPPHSYFWLWFMGWSWPVGSWQLLSFSSIYFSLSAKVIGE